MVGTGDSISPFTLEGVDGDGEIRTFDSTEMVKDGFLVLNIYVYDYSPVCTDQVCDVSELRWIDLQDDVTVAGISGDGPYSHQRFSEEYSIGYPLLCDTAEEVIEELGVVHEEKDGLRRVPQRSMFLLDADHTVRWKWVTGDNWDDWTSDPITSLQHRIEELRSANVENSGPSVECPKCGAGFSRTETGERTGYDVLGKGDLLALIRCTECQIELAVPESRHVSIDFDRQRPVPSFTVELDT